MCLTEGGIREETEIMILNVLKKWILFMQGTLSEGDSDISTQNTNFGTELVILNQSGPLYCGFRYSVS